MTADQIAALAALVGRDLTAAEIAALAPLVEVRNDVAVAAILSTGRVRLKSTPMGIGTILDVMSNGGDFIDLLVSMGATNRDIYWCIELIKQGRFELGAAKAQAQLGLIAQAAPQFAAGIAALCAVAQEPESIDFNRVSAGLNKAEGRMTLP